MNAKEAFQKHQELLDEIESRTLMDIYPTEIQSLRGYALVGNLELEAIKKRAEEKREELGAIFDEANEDNPYSVDGDDNVTYYTETAVIELIDFIIKGEKKQ